MKVPLENTQLDAVITRFQSEQDECFEPHDFGQVADPNFPLPNEIVIDIYRYLNASDLSKCAQVSKKMRSLCFYQPLEYSRKFSMAILYKRSGPFFTGTILPLLLQTCVKELINLGAYEQAKTNYGKIKARKLRLGLILHAHQCRKAKNPDEVS